MNVTCFTDATIHAQLDLAIARHVSTDVSAIIAAKQEAPSIEDVVRRARRYVGEVIVVAGASSEGAADVAPRCGARVIEDGGRGKGEAIRRAIPKIQTPIAVFL